MSFKEVFAQARELLMKLDASGVKEHLACQFSIVGEETGVFYVEIKGGRMSVEPYEYNDRDAIWICSAETLLKLVSGKLDPISAVMTGELRIEGMMEQALQLRNVIVGRQDKK
ncbi:MAG: SCP2 sterol-binding domain-containing protein [Brotaphodocola sp.]